MELSFLSHCRVKSLRLQENPRRLTVKWRRGLQRILLMAGHGLFIIVSSLSGVKVFITFRFPPNFFLYFFPIATNQSLVMEAIQVLTAVVKFYFPAIRWAWSRMQRIYLLFLQAQVEGTCWCLQGPFGPAGRTSPAACTKGTLISIINFVFINYNYSLF